MLICECGLQIKVNLNLLEVKTHIEEIELTCSNPLCKFKTFFRYMKETKTKTKEYKVLNRNVKIPIGEKCGECEGFNYINHKYNPQTEYEKFYNKCGYFGDMNIIDKNKHEFCLNLEKINKEV